jgi:predicted PilT family ATPase
MKRLPILVVLLLAAVPVVLPAQGMPAEVRRPMGPAAITDGEPISFVLENAQVIDLREDQRIVLMAIRRRLRAVNGTYTKQLDSLREMLGIDMEARPRGMSDEDRKKFQRFEALSQPITDSIKVNNDAAKMQAREVLDSVQVAKLDSIATRGRVGVPGRRGSPPPVRR